MSMFCGTNLSILKLKSSVKIIPWLTDARGLVFNIWLRTVVKLMEIVLDKKKITWELVLILFYVTFPFYLILKWPRSAISKEKKCYLPQQNF